MKCLRCILCFVFLGCSLWVPVGGLYSSQENHFEAELPAGWSRTYYAVDGITMTRDGFPLQIVQITRSPFDKVQPFTNRRLEKGMLPLEAAEVVIDNLKSNPNIRNFHVVENQPAMVGGYPGFKILYSFDTKENLNKQGVYFGALVDQWLYRILLEAPARHYFSRDLADIERVKASFKITL